jgi:hypothetical protein
MAETPKKVLRILLKPEIEEWGDGTWHGHYPGENWSVTAESREALLEKLKEEHEKQATTRESTERLLALVEESRINPIPGVEVEELSEDEYADRMRGAEDGIQGFEPE